MFVTSLYSRIVRLDTLKAEAIEKLNDVMHLATNNNALALPALTNNMIWKDANLQSVLNEAVLRDEIPEAKAKEISEQVVDMAPAWLHYSRDSMNSRESMIQDVMCLIRQGNELPMAVA